MTQIFSNISQQIPSYYNCQQTIIPNIYNVRPIQDNTAQKQIQAEYDEFKRNLTAEDKAFIFMNSEKDLMHSKKRFILLSSVYKGIEGIKLYNKIKDNNDFKELNNSKYFSGGEGFVKILDILLFLQKEREKEINSLFTPAPYGVAAQKTIFADWKKYDTQDYLRMLNNFVKNPNASDDLKKYYLATKAKDIYQYYGKLDTLQNTSNVVDKLI